MGFLKAMRRIAIFVVCLVLWANMVTSVPIPEADPGVGALLGGLARGTAGAAGSLGRGSLSVVGRGSANAGKFASKAGGEALQVLSGGALSLPPTSGLGAALTAI